MSRLISHVSAVAVTMMLPAFAFTANAADGGILDSAGGGSSGDFGGVGSVLESIVGFINTYLIPFILAIAFLVFVFGIFRFFIAGADDEEKRASGKNLMIYGLAGFVIILVFYGLVNFLVDIVGGEDQDSFNGGIPNAPTTGGSSGSGGSGGVI